MARTIDIKRDAASDMLTAEILETSPLGVVQIRAVVPMKKLRAFLDQAIATRTGKPTATVSGSPAIQRRCGPLVQRLAGIQLFRAIAKAAQSPAAEHAKRRAILMAKIAQLVEIGESDDFEDKFGGWAGVRDAQRKKRMARYRALLARGMPVPAAQNLITKAAREDAEVLRGAMDTIENDDENETLDTEDETLAEEQDQKEDPELFQDGTGTPKDGRGVVVEGERGQYENDRDGPDARVGGGGGHRAEARRQAATIDVQAAGDEPIDAANPPRN